MKKTFLTLFLMTTMFGAAYADGREKPTSVDKLPQAAQEFLSAHFKDLTVAYAVEEQKYFVSGSNYPGQFIRQIDRNAYTWEVELSNGLEIKFDNQFNVIDIDD